MNTQNEHHTKSITAYSTADVGELDADFHVVVGLCLSGGIKKTTV
jgi:hypothetical protein